MNAFRGKLRQFKRAWTAEPERPSHRARRLVGFLCNADDTPRGWADDGAVHPPSAAPDPSFPRFRQLATAEAARHAA